MLSEIGYPFKEALHFKVLVVPSINDIEALGMLNMMDDFFNVTPNMALFSKFHPRCTSKIKINS